MAKKDVFVWVARDKANEFEDRTFIFFSQKPYMDGEGRWFNRSGNWTEITSDQIRLKKGECRKFKLVEVKED